MSKHQIAYLDRVLELNPIEHSDEILSARRVYLKPGGVVDAIVVGDLDDAEERAQARRQLAHLREGFWWLDQANRTAQLAALVPSRFPEVALSAKQLQRVSDLDQAFVQLRSDSLCHPAFVKAFMEIVVAAPGEASRKRLEQMNLMLDDVTNAAQVVKCSAERIRLAYPHLFQLEAEWLIDITRFEAVSKEVKESRDTSAGMAALVIVALTVVGIIAVIRYL